MSEYSLLLGASVIANTCLLVYTLVRIRRRLPALALVGFLSAFAIANAVAIGFDEAFADPSWAGLGFASLVLGYASVALFTLLSLHGAAIRRRVPLLVAAFAPGVALAAAGGLLGWSPAEIFQPSTDPVPLTVNAYLVLCLGIALAESLADRRAPGRGLQSWSLVLASVLLVVAGPVYGFELVVLGITSFTGANLAAPVAGGLFLYALAYENPSTFRGRVPEGPRRVPWNVASGVYLVEETRPKYARALFLAASHEHTSLAIVSEPEAFAPDLAGIDIVRMVPGPRSAAILASTTGEFFGHYPAGVVLIDDASYAVTNSGERETAHALVRTLAGFPPEGTLVVSLAKLTPTEIATFEPVIGTRLAPPNVESELADILRRNLGASGDPLARAAIARGKRVEDLAVVDIPYVRDFLLASMADMRGPADDAAQSGWRRASEALAAELEALWRTPPMEARPALHVAPALLETDVPLVRAAEVLLAPTEGAPRETMSSPPSIGPAIRDAFLGSLGPAGEPVFKRVVGRLHKDPALLSRDDLPRVAKLAEEAVADLTGAIDIDAAKQDLLERTRRLRALLSGLARGDR